MTIAFENQFKPFARHIARYFKAYGGWAGVFGSPLFQSSLLITAISYSRWLDSQWTELSFALLPGLLGFSLGTYALLFSLITIRVKGALRAVKNEGAVSALEQVNATFFHFIFVQVIGLIWAFLFTGTLISDLAIFAKADYPLSWCFFLTIRALGSFFGYLMMVYSVMLVLAAALAIYRLALIADPGDKAP